MPLTKITGKVYLNELVALAPTILSEYEAALSSLHSLTPLGIQGWQLLEIYEQSRLTPNADNIPTLKTFIENLPNNVYPIMSAVSSISGGVLTDEMEHSENYPVGLHRYHIPLHTCTNAFLSVQEDDGNWVQYTWEDGFAYKFENPQNTHFLSHNDTLEDRVIIILDVYEDTPPTQDERDTCYNTAHSFLEHPNVFD